MNWIDIIIIVGVIIGAIKGLCDGLINQVVAILALAAGILFAGLLAKPIKRLFLLLPEDTIRIEIINGTSYVLAFILIMAVILLLGKVVNVVINLTPAVLLNKLAGTILGAGIWILFLSLIINLVATFDVNSTLINKDIKSKSSLYEPVKGVLPAIYPMLRDFFNK